MPEHCGNPLLRDWVKEWMDKSQSLQSKAYFTYKKAYDSLCKCPVTFSHPSEAICLAGIGEGMVKRLEENMKKYCKENNLPMPSRTVNSKVNNTESANGRSPSATQVKSRRTKPYVPAFRTGGYAILLALLNMYENNQLNGTRDQICNLAQPYCDSSFTLADAGKSYTAWNSMKTLCDKGYVWKNGKPAKYQLTDTGIELAKKLKQSVIANIGISIPNLYDSTSSANQYERKRQKNKSTTKTTTSDLLDSLLKEKERNGGNDLNTSDLNLYPNEYDIFLVLDSREIQMRGNRDYFQEHLLAKGVQCITRSMNIGDVIWVAKKKGSSNQSDELVLDYIVERKRLDDLVSSIKDGRFTEQKTRLKRSGLEKIIYVIEEYNRDEAERFGMQAIQTALSSMQIVDGIFLKRTQNIDETIDYLVSTTQLIKQIYNETTLYSIQDHIVTRQNYLNLKDAYRNKQANEEGKVAYLVNYSLFSQLNAKNGPISLHEVYLRMLMTIRGINAERALSLMKVYPTPRSLLLAFKGKTLDEAKNLAKVATQGQISRRRWGKEASDKLYQVWGALEYPNMEHNNDNDFDR
ncbi:putative DNA repair protein Mus81 [Cokeromyces recurvatus]|uniref:putative DNA repair protein Mus81 n=1 Tax=Cokeromyces recurvatus TaxID=90255 RepID=UPI002220EC54|nr:putative DNA repair protein Mus81 [Cokeromyces recurvatus]KAI7908267.1 putative DNA repair protein Mus81 [Cokeromyces recurvatus]